MKRTVPAGDFGPAGTRYGLGIAWRPGEGNDGVWFHGGTRLGVVSETGVTSEGTRAAAVAMFTLLTEPAWGDAQTRSARRLIDRALR